MSDNRSNSSGSMFSGFMLGAIAGAIAGALVTPRTGKETRKILKKSADALPEMVEDLSTSLQLQAHRFSETTLKNWEGTLERLKEAIAAGVEASQQEFSEIKEAEEDATELRSAAQDSSMRQ
jgi:gas vesicle protein